MIRNTAQEWKQHHHQAGMAQGEQTLLRRLLRHRFGDLPEPFCRRLEAASLEQLETWADRVLDAESLEAVFRSHSVRSIPGVATRRVVLPDPDPPANGNSRRHPLSLRFLRSPSLHKEKPAYADSPR